eukprot:TRINITY_DN2200_c0_g1_i1.p1 TRINITY_DN2200_c0_g1~~TRINITY_DN2200_c0_g1_i1.p1  ORF type:complete len:320 (-),score=88.98 TRINITY_DN2200_c0_g1_i1:315-1241(-)
MANFVKVALTFLLCWSLSFAFQKSPTIDKTLKFRPDGTFKIVQFTDLHFGEGEDLDENSMNVQRTILKAEQPDVVVITGDAVSGYAWDHRAKDWYQAQWEKWTSPMKELSVRWSYALGNHDDQADYSRHQIVTLDQTAEESLTQFGPAGVPGVTNFYLPVYSSNSSTEVISNLWFLDSMDDNCLGVVGWGCVYPAQVEWFRATSDAVKVSQGGTKPGLAFFHIPVPEYMYLWSNFPIHGNKTEDVCCFSVNTGLFSAFVEKRNIEAVFCGHDHNNDFYGIYNRIHLAYGRKTGYGGYGPPAGWLRELA